MKYPLLLVTTGIATLTAACASGKAAPTTPSPQPAITRAQIDAAQAAWCEALVQIGKAANPTEAKEVATKVIDTAYNYAEGPVLFKPTLTFGAQTFRTTKAGALAYFVGGDPAYPDDTGFALKQWVTCTPAIVEVAASGEMAVAMGNVHLEDVKGNKVTVDKTFGYKRDATGALRIVLHHSSLPFTPTK